MYVNSYAIRSDCVVQYKLRSKVHTPLPIHNKCYNNYVTLYETNELSTLA